MRPVKKNSGVVKPVNPYDLEISRLRKEWEEVHFPQREKELSSARIEDKISIIYKYDDINKNIHGKIMKALAEKAKWMEVKLN